LGRGRFSGSKQRPNQIAMIRVFPWQRTGEYAHG
jgi:hypothetical protein